MKLNPHGKFTRFNKQNPKAYAVCDRSGLWCMHEDLVKDEQFAGEGIYWTGMWVNPRFRDVPNPQQLTPRILADPYPIKYPRPEVSSDD